jgi:hypothetical protein
MQRRSKFALAAESWLRDHAPRQRVPTAEFWRGLSEIHPELTTPSEKRKTPRNTCMRDLRADGAFDVGKGFISLKESLREIRALANADQ